MQEVSDDLACLNCGDRLILISVLRRELSEPPSLSFPPKSQSMSSTFTVLCLCPVPFSSRSFTLICWTSMPLGPYTTPPSSFREKTLSSNGRAACSCSRAAASRENRAAPRAWRC